MGGRGKKGQIADNGNDDGWLPRAWAEVPEDGQGGSWWEKGPKLGRAGN